MVAISATNLGTNTSWNISQALFIKALEKENAKVKAGEHLEAEISKKEVLKIIYSLSRRRVQDKDVWKHLIPPLIKYFKNESITLRELSNLTHDLFKIKLQSPKLYQIITDYFLRSTRGEQDLNAIGSRLAVNFLHSLLYSHPQLNSEEMYTVIRKYIMVNIDRFNKFQLIKLLDIYKYNEGFMSNPSAQRLKQLLEA